MDSVCFGRWSMRGRGMEIAKESRKKGEIRRLERGRFCSGAVQASYQRQNTDAGLAGLQQEVNDSNAQRAGDFVQMIPDRHAVAVG